MSNYLIEAKSLSVTFNSYGFEVPAVREVDFYLDKREVVGVVGESGSGKSLTSLTLLGLLDNTNIKYTSGSIVVSPPLSSEIQEFVNPHDLKAFRGNGIGFIFQEPMTALNPALTCGTQMLEAIPRGIGKKEGSERVIQLFNEVQLPTPAEVYKKYPHQLSGGQRQRIAIARAILKNPPILILDEATSSLDTETEKGVMQAVQALQGDKTVIIVAHRLSTVEYCDRLYRLDAGRIVDEGTFDEVMNRSQS